MTNKNKDEIASQIRNSFRDNIFLLHSHKIRTKTKKRNENKGKM